MVRPLDGMLVIECAQRVAGPLATMHLSMLGAEVIKVEPAGGDATRNWGDGGPFSFLNTGKRLVSLEVGEPAGRDRLAVLLNRADGAVMDEGPAAELARQMVAEGGLRSLVVIDDGDVPGGYGASETAVQAAMAFTSYVGEPDFPARIGADLAWATAGIQASQALLAGLFAGDAPTTARVSIARALATMKTIHFAGRSDPQAWEGYHVTARNRPPDQGYRVADGRISFEFPPGAADGWREYCRWLGLEDLVAEVGDDWYQTVGMGELSDWARARYEAALAQRTAEEAVERARQLGGWAVPFATPDEVLCHPQTALFGAVFVDPAVGDEPRLAWPWKFAGLGGGLRIPEDPRPVGADNIAVFGPE